MRKNHKSIIIDVHIHAWAILGQDIVAAYGTKNSES